MPNIDMTRFLELHQLPRSYSNHAAKWFYPIVEHVSLHHISADKPLIIGVNGAQGSGKSTLADLLVFLLTEQSQLNAISISLDDFYLTKQQRQELSAEIHPLMATRGVPGTHDIPLALQTINQLLGKDTKALIPRFNKASDDRHDKAFWDVIDEPVDIIVLEGWCLGAGPQSAEDLLLPVNELEQYEDPHAYWRQYINQQLSTKYPQLFNLIDTWIMLKAPSFGCVFEWRLEQEDKLRASLDDTDKTMTSTEIKRFIKFYQRITEQLLITLPPKVDFLFELNEQRQVIRSRMPS